jgi:hypothetical protein
MAKPKLALIPSTVGGSVYSVLPSNGDGDFNFSRSSAATRINAQGLIETVAVGDNRLNYPLLDGTVQTCPHLLLEGQRTNLITYSESFSNAYWSKSASTITSNSVISPDGTLNADSIVGDGTSGNHYILAPFTAVVAQDYTVSIFVKAGTNNFFQVNLGAAPFGSTNYCNFDLSNGIIGSYGGASFNRFIEPFPNGWYRIGFTATALSSGSANLFPTLITSSTSVFLESNTLDTSIEIYGAQVEQGSYSTSYIPTSGSATTRIAEVCDGSGNASTFNDSEGVLMVQISALANDLTYRFIAISDGTNNNRVNIYFSNTLNSIGVIARTSTEILISSINTSSNIIENNKIAIKYKSGDSSFWLNGIEVATSTSTATISGLNQLRFENGDGGSDFYGNTKQIQYFDSALTDSELETLTSWMSFSDMAIDQEYLLY